MLSFFSGSRKTRVQKLAIFIIILVLCVCVPLTVWDNINSHGRKESKVANGTNIHDDGTEGITVMLNVHSYDARLSQVSVSFSIPFSPPENKQYASLSLSCNNRIINFDPKESFHRADLNFPLTQGSTFYYPFEELLLESMSFRVFNTTSNVSYRLIVYLSGTVDGLTIGFGHFDAVNPHVDEDPVTKETVAVFSLRLTRSITARGFAVGIGLLMWTLALSLAWLVITLVLRDRKVEPPTIGVAAGILFALPQIRNSQPDIPEIGCIADIASYMWCISIVALSLIILIWNYVFKYKSDNKLRTIGTESTMSGLPNSEKTYA
ncbi:hypothetical protein HDU91_005773 [Kappamyces sp. JEL0680]|nr:hypothetical protein HDU91_005773 [Kappamyces sp. JEL0680]